MALTQIPTGLAQVPAEAVQLKPYHNSRWSFCVSYPAGWDLNESLDGAGIRVSKGGRAPVVSITVGALPSQPRGFLTGDFDDDTPMTLRENGQYYLKNLGDQPDRKVEVQETRSTQIAGVPAVWTRVRLEDRTDVRVEESIWLLRKGAVFSLSLNCKSSDFALYDLVFRQVLETFKPDCRQAPRPKRR
jgi:hypothetical protein